MRRSLSTTAALNSLSWVQQMPVASSDPMQAQPVVDDAHLRVHIDHVPCSFSRL